MQRNIELPASKTKSKEEIFNDFLFAAGHDELDNLRTIWINNPDCQQFLLTFKKFWTVRHAAEHGAKEVLTFLLDKATPQQQVEILEENDYYAFCAAADAGHANIVELLWRLTKDPDLHRNMFRIKDYYAFVTAVKYDRLAVIQFLWSVIGEEQKEIVLQKLLNNKINRPLYKLSIPSLKIIINMMAETASPNLMPLIKQLPYFSKFIKQEAATSSTEDQHYSGKIMHESSITNIAAPITPRLGLFHQTREKIPLERLQQIKDWSQTYFNYHKLETNLLNIFSDIFGIILPPEKCEKIPDSPFYQVFASEGNIQIQPAKDQIGFAYKQFYDFMQICGSVGSYPNYPDSFPALAKEPEVLGKNWDVLNNDKDCLHKLADWVNSIITKRINPVDDSKLADASIERMQSKLDVIVQAIDKLKLPPTIASSLPALTK